MVLIYPKFKSILSSTGTYVFRNVWVNAEWIEKSIRELVPFWIYMALTASKNKKALLIFLIYEYSWIWAYTHMKFQGKKKKQNKGKQFARNSEPCK